MRIAAGVLLIIAAVFNGCGAVGYLGIGGMSAAVGTAASESADQIAAETGENADDVRKASDDATATGGMLMIMGLFLAVLFGLQIAAGVVLFLRKAATFVFVVAGLGIVAEVIGMAITTVGFTNLFGIVACIFGIIAARQLQQTGAAPPPAASPPPAAAA